MSENKHLGSDFGEYFLRSHEELAEQLVRTEAALAKCVAQRNMVHAEECDDVKCMIPLDAEIKEILEEKMTELFTESDFTDHAGYMKNSKYVVEIANTRLKALIMERNKALEFARLAAEKMAEFVVASQRERGLNADE